MTEARIRVFLIAPGQKIRSNELLMIIVNENLKKKNFENYIYFYIMASAFSAD